MFADFAETVYDNVNVEESLFENNIASENGGAIYDNGTLTIKTSTISGNTAENSGDFIYNLGEATVSDSTITTEKEFGQLVETVDPATTEGYDVQLCMKCFLGFSNFLEDNSSLSHSIVFLFLCIVH